MPMPSLRPARYQASPLPDITSMTGPPIADSASPGSQHSLPQRFSGLSPGANVPAWQSPPTADASGLHGQSLEFPLDNTVRLVRLPNGARQASSGEEDTLPRVYNMLPRTCEAQCPLDVLLLEFVGKTQRLAAQGVPLSELAGPPYPTFNPLLNPKTRHESHPLSKLFTDILQTFPDISTLPEQAAIVYIMFLVMRWQVHPSKENYDRLPEWVTPRPSSLFIPHACWLDYLPWYALSLAKVESRKLTKLGPCSGTLPFSRFQM
jgi:hypothetical protein